MKKNAAKPPLMAAEGVVDLATADSLGLPPRLRQLRMLRGIFFIGAATPPRYQERKPCPLTSP